MIGWEHFSIYECFNERYGGTRYKDLSIGRQRQRGIRARAIGQVVHCGRQLATAEARLIGPDGTLYAHASTACLVFEMPSPTGNKP